MATTQFMNNAELTWVLQELMPERTMDDIVFTDILRPRSIEEQIILFEQRDSFSGYTPARALGTGFGQVAREAKSRITLNAVGYGEEKIMDEAFMLNSRQMGTFGSPLRLAEEQMSDQLNLIDRFIKRYKYNVWQLLTTGKYTALGPKGELVGQDSYTFQQFTVAVAWSNFAAATPLLDLRTMKLLHRGQSASFGKKAKIYLQSQDVNNLLSNTNPNDLGAKRVITQNAGAQPFQLADVNRFLLDDDLPQIVEYDEFLPTGPSNFGTGPAPYTMFIPYQTGVCIGARDYGDPVGDYTMVPTFGDVMTENGQVKQPGARPDNPWANIYFDFRLDMEKWEAKSRIAFSGAPRILFPSAIITMNLN